MHAHPSRRLSVLILVTDPIPFYLANNPPQRIHFVVGPNTPTVQNCNPSQRISCVPPARESIAKALECRVARVNLVPFTRDAYGGERNSLELYLLQGAGGEHLILPSPSTMIWRKRCNETGQRSLSELNKSKFWGEIEEGLPKTIREANGAWKGNSKLLEVCQRKMLKYVDHQSPSARSKSGLPYPFSEGCPDPNRN